MLMQTRVRSHKGVVTGGCEWLSLVSLVFTEVRRALSSLDLIIGLVGNYKWVLRTGLGQVILCVGTSLYNPSFYYSFWDKHLLYECVWELFDLSVSNLLKMHYSLGIISHTIYKGSLQIMTEKYRAGLNILTRWGLSICLIDWDRLNM